MQKICTDGKGEKIPIKKETVSVKDVIVIETAASLSIFAIRSGTDWVKSVRLHAANMTNVSSIPTPKIQKSRLIL